MKKLVLFFAVALMSLLAKSQQSPVTSEKKLMDSKMPVDSIVIYKVKNEPCDQSRYLKLLKDDTLSNCFIKYKALNKIDSEKLMKVFNKETSYGGSWGITFTTDFGFLLFEKGAIVGSIELNFSGNRISSSQFKFEAVESYKRKRKINEIAGMNAGFKESAMKKIKKLIL